MDYQNNLGIYLAKDSATVLCLGNNDKKVVGCFSVSVEQQQQNQFQVLANMITQGCADRHFKFSEVAVALDSALFMQHNVRSEFSDVKQIASTIRFDTEEALATDISEVALAFKTIFSSEKGSKLLVFTAQQKILSEIIVTLQSKNLDPVSIEPDINSLSRFICEKVPAQHDVNPLFAVLSNRNGYFIALSQAKKKFLNNFAHMRTFLVGHSQNRSSLLKREMPVTTALFQTASAVNAVNIYDTQNSVDIETMDIKQRTEKFNLIEAFSDTESLLIDCPDPVDFAIAYGAALAHLEPVKTVNFRNDFMPYLGKKQRLERTVKFFAVSLTVLALAAGIYFQMPFMKTMQYSKQLREKFSRDYLSVMFEEKELPAKTRDAEKKLGGEYRRIENDKKGLLSVTGKKAVSAKLLIILEAFNECAESTKLQIDSLAITTKSISVSGSTSSRPNTLILRKALEQTKLGTLQERLEPKAGRDNFNITIVPEK